MVDLDDVKTGNGRDRKPGVAELAQLFKFPEKKWVTLRLLPGMAPEAGYWVKTKKKDGKFTKFYTPCPSFDPATQQRDGTKPDPWRDLQLAQQDSNVDRDDQLVQYSSHFWMNAIIRAEQKKQPSSLPKKTKAEAKSGFKDKESDTWTPVFVIKIGKSFASKVKELKGLNTVESKKTGAVKTYSVNDPVYGRDIRVLYDSSKAPADQYQVQLGDKRTPLDEDEQAYLTWDIETITAQEFNEATIKADFESWARRMGVKISLDSDDEDEDEDDTPKKGKKVKKSKPVDEDGFDDEDDTPKKGKKGKKSKPVEDDEDEDGDDFDDEDDDEDDEPPKKSKGKAPAKGKKSKPVDEDEDDEDSEDDFDEDDEDEPPKNGKKGKKSKPVEDDEDEDDDFDDEDEPPTKSKKPAGKSAKKSKPVDEDEDDDFDEDEDEDDEPPTKSKAKPAKGKKSKPVEDDEDEDDDFDDE